MSEESVEERQARLGRTEVLFRAVNERLVDLDASLPNIRSDELWVVCECGEATCIEQIEISPADYARIRDDPALFVLVPGHEDATVEAVVERGHTPYLVVRKHAGVLTDLPGAAP